MYQALEQKIGIQFKNQELLKTAFTHRSYVNEHRNEPIEHNERLEFLGDAVLELVVTEYLFKNYPQDSEGQLTTWRSALVKGNNLANVATVLEVGNYLQLSRGEEKSGGREKPYILANAVESLIGAIYLDHGYKTAHEFIDKFIIHELNDIIKKGLHIDAKSLFQEISQEKLNITPHYEVMEETGPDHEKQFKMGAFHNENCIAEGIGSSKQKAEEDAATHALEKMGWGK